jgi:hypothetical protein
MKTVTNVNTVVILICTLLSAIGCRDVTGPDVTGQYSLLSVDGTLPAVVYQSATEKDEVIDGSASINADQSWSINLVTRVTTGQNITTSIARSKGMWTLTKNRFSLRDDSDGSTMTAVYDGDNFVLTIVKNGLTFVYHHDAATGFCSHCL